MDIEQRDKYLQEQLDNWDLAPLLKSQAIEAEVYSKQSIMDRIINEEETVSETQKDLVVEIRKLHLINQKHIWDDNLKIAQAKFFKWGKKEYQEKIQNITHNFTHLITNLENDEFDLHFSLINLVDAHEDTIEILLKIHEKRQQNDEFLKENPAESFINRIAKERVDIK
jgi:hypothetical protein